MKNHRLAQLSRDSGYYFEFGFDDRVIGLPRSTLRICIQGIPDTDFKIDAYETGWDFAHKLISSGAASPARRDGSIVAANGDPGEANT